MRLFLDTTVRDKIVVELWQDSQQLAAVEVVADQPRAQQVLPTIADLLAKKSIALTDITQISVNPGPGSFTGTRVGVTVANGLAVSLGVPVNGLPIGQTVSPIYDHEPHIS